ncbi:MAG: NADH-quinone oxidoreductase subunit A [Bacteroidetes bacterium]|nr:NADH-quinone oxidoreductase subunit A [Bacteroidota bacterium]
MDGLIQVLLFTLLGIAFIVVTLTVSRLLGPNRPNPEKNSSYESGEQAGGDPWPKISTGYYVVALLFLLFELEIILLLPVAAKFGSTTDWSWVFTTGLEILFFLLVLSVGLAYAWVNGHLDWMKPKPASTENRSVVPPQLYEEFNKKQHHGH